MSCRVDFYLLPDEQISSLQGYACQLAKQAWQNKQRILILTDGKALSQAIDDALWTDEPLSFIPHGISCDTDNDEQDILISHRNNNPGQFELLINLSEMPANPAQSPHIIELLNQQDARKQAGREHYKIYRQQDCELHHHQLEMSDL